MMPMIVVLMSVTVSVIVIVIVIVAFTSIIAPALVLMPISRYIIVVIPVISHEIDAPTAGSVLGTVPSPVPLITRRDTQIDRRFSVFRSSLDNDRVLIDHLWWRITADVELPIEARLAHVDGYSHLSDRRSGGHYEYYCE